MSLILSKTKLSPADKITISATVIKSRSTNFLPKNCIEIISRSSCANGGWFPLLSRLP